MNTSSSLCRSCLPSKRIVCVSAAALAPSLFADPLRADLFSYSAAPGLTAAVSDDALTVTWNGDANTTTRARPC